MKYFLEKLPIALLTLVIVATICFSLTKLAGEEAAFGERDVTPEVRAEISRQWGLDRPIYVQYWLHMRRLLVLDSMESRVERNKTLRDILGSHLPSSVRLGARALMLALLLGVPIGVLCAVYHNGAIDNGGTFLSLTGVSVPSFILASFAIYFLSRKWNLLPAIGWEHPTEEFRAFGFRFFLLPEPLEIEKPLSEYGFFHRIWLHFLIFVHGTLEEIMRLRLWIPAACLGAFPFAAIMRLTRSAMLDALQQDYVRTARAKGLSPTKVIARHALRNALTPVVTYIGPVTAGILTGSLVVEKIFSIPGLGRYFIESVSNRDMPIIMGLTVFYSAFLILMNLLVDAVYPILNPRLKR